MKKLLTLALALLMIFALVACNGDGTTPAPDATPTEPAGDTTPDPGPEGPENPDPTTDDGTFEIALITDLGTIDDKSFNQGSWEGVVAYAVENGITYKYFQPAAQSDDAYLNAIDLAVQSGAKIVVTPGFLFEVPIFQAQELFPQVKFVLLDGSPNNGDWDNFEGKVGDNTVSVLYAEEQSGFLAGYAAVKDGYTKLGFMGGMAVPAVKRFGHGYVQGAEYAAAEMGLEAGAVTIDYFYTGTFEPSADIVTRAAAWYSDGVEVIFSCGGGIYLSIVQAAEAAGAVVIGVDVDQSAESETIITSAMKLLTKSVYDCLAAFYADAFPGGQTLIFAADNDGVGLPMETSKFNTFTQADYDAVYAALVSGEIVVDNNSEIDADAIPVELVSLNFLT